MSSSTASLPSPGRRAAARLALGLAALACALPAAAQPASGPSAAAPASVPASAELSRAEQLVFNAPHLQDLEPPRTLHYRFVKRGALEPAFEDEVKLTLRADPRGGCCSASGAFLSGERRLALPDIDEARSNPVILYFLEHDVREMQRRTKGQSAYFRKRIRLAMVDAATVRDTVVRWGGRELPAQEVRVTPYADDPMRGRYERHAGKEYRFVLARGVPGGVYQLASRVPGDQPGEPPAIEEILTLAEPADRPAPGAAR